MTHYPLYDSRTIISLPSVWDFSFFEHHTLSQVSPELIPWNDHLPLPGCFDALETYAGLKGTGCYRTLFRLQRDADLRLHIGAMGLSCRVYCDRQLTGESFLPFTPLDMDFHADAGEHELLIMIDNHCDEKAIPQFQLDCDFYAYGGIYYDLTLQELPAFRIERVQVRILELQRGAIRLHCIFGGLIPESTDVQIRIDRNAPFTVHCRIHQGTADFACTVPEPHLWTPEQPCLHLVRCEIAEDAVTERFGLRTIAAEGKTLLLNGQPLKLLGMNRHEHHPDFGYAVPDAVQVNDLMLIRQCGCNFIRGSHYPQNQNFLDRCDEMGILVWEEGLAWGKDRPSDMENRTFIDAEKKNIRAMIEQSINHPSIILWGFLNECASYTEEARALYRDLRSLVKELDSSRLLTFAVVQSRNHKVLEYADVIAMNCYPGWYDTEEEDIRTLNRIVPFLEETRDYIDSMPESRDKPFIVSEIGAAAFLGFHDRFHARWTEEYQAELHRTVTDYICANPSIAGVALWMFADTRTGMQGRILRRPRGYNNKGVFDEYRRPKEAVRVITENFRKFFQK